VPRSARLDVAIGAAVIAQQVAGKVVRDALFLSSFPATSLPPVIAIASVVSLAAVLLMSTVMAKRGPASVVPVVFALSGVAFLVEWLLAPVAPRASAALVYVHTAVAGGLMISGFWSIVNERFDPHAARRNIVRIGIGATLGGLIGGLGSKATADLLDPRSLLLLLAVTNLLAAWGVRALAGTVPVVPRSAPPFREALEPLGRRPYLRNIAALVVVVALLEILLDCALKHEAELHLHDARALVSFFALFHTSVSLLTFLLQATLSGVFLDRLGLGVTLAVLPACVTLGAAGALGRIGLVTIAVAAGLEMALASSLFRSAYEILFTPIPVAQKRALKVVIDVALPRLGILLGSGAVAVVVALALPLDATLLACAAGLGVIGLVVSVRLHDTYVGELATSLQLGIVDLRESEAVDATTRQTIMSTMALDRGRLLAQIEASRRAVPLAGPEEDPDAQLVAVLSEGLVGDDFDVLHGNARALSAICVRKPHLAPSRARIFGWVAGALTVDTGTWLARRRLRTDPADRVGPHRGLELVFILLSVVLDRARLKDCLESLERSQPRLRGTALEYLDNVLPSDVAARLRAKLEARP
jgi:ATP:ADP antiporter, AAA family